MKIQHVYTCVNLILSTATFCLGKKKKKQRNNRIENLKICKGCWKEEVFNTMEELKEVVDTVTKILKF